MEHNRKLTFAEGILDSLIGSAPAEAQVVAAEGYRTLSQAERDELSAQLDREDEEWFSWHCRFHGSALHGDGSCQECEADIADQRVQDR